MELSRDPAAVQSDLNTNPLAYAFSQASKACCIMQPNAVDAANKQTIGFFPHSVHAILCIRSSFQAVHGQGKAPGAWQSHAAAAPLLQSASPEHLTCLCCPLLTSLAMRSAGPLAKRTLCPSASVQPVKHHSNSLPKLTQDKDLDSSSDSQDTGTANTGQVAYSRLDLKRSRLQAQLPMSYSSCPAGAVCGLGFRVCR